MDNSNRNETFLTNLKELYQVGCYNDVIHLAEIISQVATFDVDYMNQVIYYLVSAYNALGNTVQAIFILENQIPNLSHLNCYLLAKFYYVSSKFSQFLHFSTRSVSIKMEDSSSCIYENRFGRYSCYVARLLGDYCQKNNYDEQVRIFNEYALSQMPYLNSCYISQMKNRCHNSNILTIYQSLINQPIKRTLSVDSSNITFDISLNQSITLTDLDENNQSDSRNSTSGAIILNSNPVIDYFLKIAQFFYFFYNFKFDECSRAFDLLPVDVQNLPTMINHMALLYYHKHEYEKSVEIFKSLRIVYPYYYYGFGYFSSALYQLNKLSLLEALAVDLKRALPLSSETWVVSGNYYSSRKQHESAIECFQRAIKIDNNNFYAFALLGKEYMDIDCFDEAAYAFKQSLKVNHYSYQTWYMISETYMSQSNYNLASTSITFALKSYPDNPILLSYAAHIYAINNNFAAAINLINKAITVDHKNSSYYKIQKARLLLQNKKSADARDILVEIQPNDAKNAELLLLLGKAYLNLEKLELAEKNISEAISNDLGGKFAAEGRKLMGKIGLLHSGITSSENVIIDFESDNYIKRELLPAKNILKFYHSLKEND